MWGSRTVQRQSLKRWVLFSALQELCLRLETLDQDAGQSCGKFQLGLPPDTRLGSAPNIEPWLLLILFNLQMTTGEVSVSSLRNLPVIVEFNNVRRSRAKFRESSSRYEVQCTCLKAVVVPERDYLILPRASLVLTHLAEISNI